VAEKICNASFSNRWSTFLVDYLDLRRELKKRDSLLKIYVRRVEEPVKDKNKNLVFINPSAYVKLHKAVHDDSLPKDLEGLNMWQQWLVKVLAKICYTSIEDILSCLIKLECQAVRKPKKRNKKRQIPDENDIE